MVWKCMSAQGVDCLHIVDGNMNADKYLLFPLIVSSYKARITMVWLSENDVFVY